MMPARHSSAMAKWGTASLLAVVAYWTIQLLQLPGTLPPPWIFLDNFNLLVHEAGHWIFSPFGQLLTILGGSLLQVLLPVIVTAAFVRQQDAAGIGFGCFWIGSNLISVSHYIFDAPTRSLPLLGGDRTGHDWYNLLNQLNLMSASSFIAYTTWAIGAICVIAAIAILVIATITAWQHTRPIPTIQSSQH